MTNAKSVSRHQTDAGDFVRELSSRSISLISRFVPRSTASKSDCIAVEDRSGENPGQFGANWCAAFQNGANSCRGFPATNEARYPHRQRIRSTNGTRLSPSFSNSASASSENLNPPESRSEPHLASDWRAHEFNIAQSFRNAA